MTDEPDERLQELSSNIKMAKELYKEQTSSTDFENSEASEGEIKSARAGSEFLASVFGGGLIGYMIDWMFGTLPWGVIFFLIMGFVSGVYRANAQMSQENEEKTK